MPDPVRAADRSADPTTIPMIGLRGRRRVRASHAPGAAAVRASPPTMTIQSRPRLRTLITRTNVMTDNRSRPGAKGARIFVVGLSATSILGLTATYGAAYGPVERPAASGNSWSSASNPLTGPAGSAPASPSGSQRRPKGRAGVPGGAAAKARPATTRNVGGSGTAGDRPPKSVGPAQRRPATATRPRPSSTTTKRPATTSARPSGSTSGGSVSPGGAKGSGGAAGTAGSGSAGHSSSGAS